MDTLLFVLLEGILNAVCFYIGAKIGQQVVNREEVKLPIVNTIETINKMEENRQVKLEQSKYETLMENIDNYDGTSLGQKDIPRQEVI